MKVFKHIFNYYKNLLLRVSGADL